MKTECPACGEEMLVKHISNIEVLHLCEKCYYYIFKTTCVHELKIHKYKKSNGSICYANLCIKCWEKTNDVKKELVENKEIIPFRDDDFIKKFRDERYFLHQQIRESIWNKRNALKATIEKEQKEKWFNEHNDYLKSEKWRLKREKVLRRDHYLCQSCLSAKATEVHHTTYKHWMNEPLFELVAVCTECHDRITQLDRDEKK